MGLGRSGDSTRSLRPLMLSLKALERLGLTREEAKRLRRELQRLDRYEKRLWKKARQNEVNEQAPDPIV